MAREIELKLPLTQEQYKKIQELVTHQQKNPDLMFGDFKKLFKLDEYYSRFASREERIKNNEPKVIRIRCEKDESNLEKAFFTIKNKKIENGIEVNEENETFVENPQVLRNMFEQTGFIKWFSKKKEALSCMCKRSGSDFEFHLELETVNELLYVEIECTKDEDDVEKIQQELILLVEKLGLDSKNRDSRSWVEILDVTRSLSLSK